MKIRHQLVMGFSVLVLMVSVAGYFAVAVARQALIRSIGSSSERLAIATIDKIDRTVHRRIEESQVYATRDVLRRTLQRSNQEFSQREDVQAYIDARDQEWRTFPQAGNNAFMNTFIINDLATEFRNMMNFYAKNNGYYIFGEIFVTNKYGANVAQTNRTSDYQQADEEWWQTAKENGLFVDDVHFDESAQLYSIDICIRVDDEEGNFLGVIKFVWNINEIIEILKRVENEEVSSRNDSDTLKLQLMTRDGRYIYVANQENERILKFTNKAFLADITKHSHFWIAEEGLEKGKKLFAYATSKGFSNYKGFGWTLVIEYQAEDILQPVVKLRNVLLLAVLSVLIVVVFINLFAYQSIIIPILKLKDYTDEVGKGRLDTKIKFQSKDELGELADAFNKMTSDLKEKQSIVLQSEKLASIGQLAAGIAHEINNPVGFVSSNLQTLDEYLSIYLQFLHMTESLKNAVVSKNAQKVDVLIKQIEEFEKDTNLNLLLNDVDNLLQESQRGLERVKKIVKDLRTFAREDTEAIELIKVEDILSSILSIVHNELKHKAELKKEYGDTPLIRANPQKLGQVFLNLLINAVQAIENSGTIRIKTYQKERYVCVEVSDDGKGIPPESIHKIFDPFYTTKPVGEGTGLGLSISYDIVRKHEGEIKVSSELGRGTTFTVMFPIP